MKRTFQISAVAIAILILTGTWSYLRTGTSQALEYVQNSIPIDFEIKRAETLIDDIQAEIRDAIYRVATIEVEITSLSDQIVAGERELVAQQDSILKIRDVIQRNEVPPGSYTTVELKQDLAAKFNRFKSREVEISSLRSIRTSKETILAASREKLQKLVDAKGELATELAQLEARWSVTKTDQTNSDWGHNQSKTADAKQAVDKLRERIAIAETVLKTEIAVEGRIEIAPESTDIMQSVEERFGKERLSP